MTRTDPYSLRHQAQRSAGDADQAEFLALKKGSMIVDAGIYDERVAGAMDDFETQDVAVGESWHAEDLKYDSAVGQIHEEIERRRAIMEARYPFSIEGGTLVHSPSENSIYEFLLAICNAETITAGEHVRLPRLFERLSARLVAAYFGADTRFIHTGAPRDPEVGSSFKEAMLTVAEKTSEWRWDPEPDLPDEPVHGDSGCDFVVWPVPPDGRQIGQLFILGQCACGNNWDTKLNDLTIKKLEKWFKPLSIVDPVRCFTTPFHITDAMLKDASRDGGIVFDRARLVGISHRAANGTIGQDILSRMNELITLVIGEPYQISGSASTTA